MTDTNATTRSVVPAGQGESRWPVTVTVLAMIALVLLPPYALPGIPWLVAGVLLVFLVTLLVADPGRFDDRSRRVRRISLALVGFMLLLAFGSTAVLIIDLIDAERVTEDLTVLLLAGTKVWLGNNVAFAFLYWQMDRGGPAERAASAEIKPDLGFPQGGDYGEAYPGWRPVFWDYLYVAFTTANAFSPTDTMPLTHRAKAAMASQALISFALVGLVLARAVSMFA